MCVVLYLNNQTMFQYVTSLMKQGYQEESARQRHLSLSPKDRPEKNTALWDASTAQTVCTRAAQKMCVYIVYLLSRFLHGSCLSVTVC